MQRPLDTIDALLLETLQADGRVTQSMLAEKTGLSIPAVGERIKKLEEAAFITTYRAILDPKKIGYDVSAFVAVSMESSRHYRNFLDHAHDTPEIIECHAVTGEGTYMLKIRVENTSMLERFLSKIQSWQGVAGTTTRVVLSSPKETTMLPIRIKKTNAA